MIITFIYTVPSCERVFYGKFIGYINENYENGLDMELTHIIFPVLQKYYNIKDESDATVGIISHHRKEGPDYFSENEKNVFTMLYCKWSAQPSEIFMNGKPFTLYY